MFKTLQNWTGWEKFKSVNVKTVLHEGDSLFCPSPVRYCYDIVQHNIHGLAQDCSNFIANALELLQSWTNPATWYCRSDDYKSEKNNQTLKSHLSLLRVSYINGVSCILEKSDFSNHNCILQMSGVKNVLKSAGYEAILSLYIVPIIKKIVNNFKWKNTVYVTPTYRRLYQYKDATLQV